MIFGPELICLIHSLLLLFRENIYGLRDQLFTWYFIPFGFWASIKNMTESLLFPIEDSRFSLEKNEEKEIDFGAGHKELSKGND